MHRNGGNEMDNAMKSTFGIGIVDESVLVLCTGAVPAGLGIKRKTRMKEKK